MKAKATHGARHVSFPISIISTPSHSKAQKCAPQGFNWGLKQYEFDRNKMVDGVAKKDVEATGEDRNGN